MSCTCGAIAANATATVPALGQTATSPVTCTECGQERGSITLTARDAGSCDVTMATGDRGGEMPAPDIQYFSESGTWHKPVGAIRIDALIQPSGGGGALGQDGVTPVLQTWSRDATDLGDTIEVEIGKGGRGAPGCGDGADGYAVIVTHVAP